MTYPAEPASQSRPPAAFVRDNTRLISPPLIPEIRLHLAEEPVPLWTKTEEELGQMNVPPPYWAFAWAGGQALARYLLDNPFVCHGKTVADLGAGSGLTAIAASMTGARSVTAYDVDQFALAACRLNSIANGVEFGLSCTDILREDVSATDIVLVGDLFYERDLAEHVLAFITTAKGRGAAVLIGDPQRSYFPQNRFTMLASYQVPVTRDLEDTEIKNTAVWQA